MFLMHENLARVQIRTRRGETQQRRRGHELARVHRLTHRAEVAAQRARVALARAL